MSTELTQVTTQPAAITEAQLTILTQRTPAEVIRQRPGPGGKLLSYVEHAWVTEQLNLAFNWAWSWGILEWRLLPEQDPSEVFVLGKLTIHSQNGDLVKSQFGSSDVKRDRQGKPISIGDDLKAASSDALKKCASLLGLALDLYHSDDDRHAEQPKAAPAASKPDQPNGGTHGNGHARDPMTAFWMAAHQKGLSQQQGQALLAQAGGDAAKALALLN